MQQVRLIFPRAFAVWTQRRRRATLFAMTLKAMPAPDLVCDVAIVGGGLAGATCALALARAGLDAVVIDAAPPAAMLATEYDGRTTAISFANARLLQRLGVWDAFADAAGPIRHILVTDGRAKDPFRKGGTSLLSLHFDSAELEPETPLGWIVENNRMRAALYAAIGETDGARVIAPAMCTQMTTTQGGARLTLASGERVSAKLVVAADGRRSALRDQAGIKLVAWGYPQTAIVATLACSLPHEDVAHEYFLPSGPFALLPMTDNRVSLVWTEKNAKAQAYLNLDDAGFLQAIRDRAGPIFGEIEVTGPRFSYPLSLSLATRFVADRMVLIGDAAHGIHPIAGQGFNLGLKDIAALEHVLGDAAALGLDIGAAGVLQGYERWRRFDSATLAMATDIFDRLFSNDIAPVRLARDLGMAAVGRVPQLRTFFMRQAGGDVGRMPRLLRA